MNDPAVLLYTSDFLTGTMDMTFEEKGQYITLLCYQHQKGHIKEETIRLLVGLCSDTVMKHFILDENNLYYNNRMDIEKEKRNNFTNSRRENGKLGGRPISKNNKPNAKPSGYPKNNLMENDNEDINNNINNNNLLINKEYIIDYYINNINSNITGIEYEKLEPYIEKFKNNLDIIKYAIDICIINKAYHINYLCKILESYIKNNYKPLNDIKNIEIKKDKEKEIELEEETKELFDYDWLEDIDE